MISHRPQYMSKPGSDSSCACSGPCLCILLSVLHGQSAFAVVCCRCNASAKSLSAASRQLVWPAPLDFHLASGGFLQFPASSTEWLSGASEALSAWACRPCLHSCRNSLGLQSLKDALHEMQQLSGLIDSWLRPPSQHIHLMQQTHSLHTASGLAMSLKFC